MGTITELVRELRKKSTPAEKAHWQELRKKKLDGFKFLRQQPIIYQTVPQKFFVADFYCGEKKLIIELDGLIHDYQLDYDQNRDAILKELGLRVLRYKNSELENMGDVLDRIADALRE